MAATDEKPSGHDRTTASPTAEPSSFFAVDWVKAASAGPIGFYSGIYHGALGAAARQLRVQAEYLQKLSETDQPADVIACYSEFARVTLAGLAGEGRRVFDQGLTMVSGRK
jgi:hypothetical protein